MYFLVKYAFLVLDLTEAPHVVVIGEVAVERVWSIVVRKPLLWSASRKLGGRTGSPRSAKRSSVAHDRRLVRS